MAKDFEPTYRKWEEDRIVAQATREEWTKRVKDAAKNGSERPSMPREAIEPPEPMRPRVIVSDTTPEKLGQLLAAHPKGLMLYRDEMSGWLQGFDRYNNGGERSLWIEAYGGRTYTIDRVKAREPIIIPHLTISILGGIQPDKLAELLKGADDGLPARFLWNWADSVPPRRPQYVPRLESTVAALRHLSSLEMGADRFGTPQPHALKLSEKAASMLEAWRGEHFARAQTLVGPIASSYGKQPGQLIRLALVIEHLWWCCAPTRPAAAGEADRVPHRRKIGGGGGDGRRSHGPVINRRRSAVRWWRRRVLSGDRLHAARNQQ
jgi:hypothetical protein